DHHGQTLVERLVLLDLVLQRADGLLHVERGHVDVLLGSRGVRLVLLRLLHGLADLDRVDALGDAARGLDNPEDALDRARADLHAGDRQIAPRHPGRAVVAIAVAGAVARVADRMSTRLKSSHVDNSYAVHL